jgi:hypothetical protein
MVRPSLARGAIVAGAGLATIALIAACSKSEPASQSTTEPGATPTAAPSASGVPPAFAPTVPPAPVVMAPEEPSPSPQATTTSAPHQAPSPPAAPKSLARPSPTTTPTPTTSPHANKPKADDDGLHATPAPSLGVKKVAVLANNHYTCSSNEKRDNVAAFAEPRGARISIVGQGPCPGEVHDWSAQVTQARVEVQGTHGSASKCRCVGSGELVLRGLDPGTYEIAVNGGFDRPIATRITVLQ